MAKIKFASALLFFTFILIGCQNNNLDLNEEVTSIEVYEWDSEEIVATIDDQEFIEELVKELDSAKTASTAEMSIARGPDYEVHFNNNGQTLFQINYYKEVMNLGVEGRYQNFSEDIMYNVELRLPIE
ncbi:DUF5301 domain-containing protein [Alkalibacillus almallahensis]|uniref:DUF5301 domain-containing protein n=1 Tax=Alkalibacillus almallahensis TaxID=1379154 RepID=UPI00141E1218|nr:DUF5301 domain-containing protein [Alkalibacillus almallahensis]NIK11714.1 hypothetical protein [Alkalibacillus almallahensis]